MPRTKEQNEKIREQTSKKIKDAALELFAKKGFAASSINDIAKKAGVSKGLAYNYFKNKDDIAKSIFDDLKIMFAEMMQQVESANDEGKKLEKMIDFTIKSISERTEYWLLYISFMIQPSVIKMEDEAFKNFVDEIFLYLENIFKKLGYKNYKAEARIFGAILDGFSFHYILSGGNYPVEELRKALIERYTRRID